MTVDYTLLFGGESQKVTGEEQVENWKDQTDHIDSFQHIYTLVHLDWHSPISQTLFLALLASVPNTDTVYE